MISQPTKAEKGVPANRRLIYVLNRYAPDDSTHFAHVVPLLKRIVELGVDVAVVIEKVDGELPPVTEGFSVHPVRSTNWRVVRWWRTRREIMALLAGGGQQEIFVRISQWGALAAISARRRTASQVFFWSSGQTAAAERARPVSLFKLRDYLGSVIPFRATLRWADYLVTGPESMVDYYVHEYGIERNRVKVLYNDVDPVRFRGSTRSGQAVRETLGIPPHSKVLLVVQRFSPVRRTEVIMEPLLRRLAQDNREDVVVIMVGGGPRLETIRRLVNESGFSAKVRLLGSVPNADLPAIYAASDIFGLASAAEGFPRTVVEAMINGLSIVSTDAGGTRDILAPRQLAYVVPVAQPEAFAAKAIHLLDNPAERKILEAENLRASRRFHTDRVAEMYVSTILGKSGNPHLDIASSIPR